MPPPSVGAEHFEVDKKHVFAYSQCRGVRDLDLASMINLSTIVNKTRQNSTQSKQLMWTILIHGSGRKFNIIEEISY